MVKWEQLQKTSKTYFAAVRGENEKYEKYLTYIN